METWNEQKLRLIRERGALCERCKTNPAIDAHHSCINRMKNIKELDDERNILLVCRTCHKPSWEFRVFAWETNCIRYGKQSMLEWLLSVPLKIKPNFENYL